MKLGGNAKNPAQTRTGKLCPYGKGFNLPAAGRHNSFKFNDELPIDSEMPISIEFGYWAPVIDGQNFAIPFF